MTLAERFWSHVDRSGDCWVWTGNRWDTGYGCFLVGGKRQLASRVSWELANGEPPPAGLCVCHRCDNPPCVRPDHLFLGTKAENAADMAAKGRAHKPKGELHPLSKLRGEDITAIRSLRQTGSKVKDLATRFDVCPSTISKIVSNKRWSHIEEAA